LETSEFSLEHDHARPHTSITTREAIISYASSLGPPHLSYSHD